MLRPLVRLALDLLIALIGLGLLIARAWGWSEYASRDLYVVYYQIAAPQTRYFVVRADGSGAGGQLTWPGDMVYQVACSPDGRALAVLTLDGHLLVLTSAGVVSNRVENPIYSTLSVGNDGTVALFDPTYDTLLVNDRSIELSAPGPVSSPYDRVDISAQGLVLWMRDFQTIEVVSLASGQVIPYVPHGYSGAWLASGAIFAYADNMTDTEGNGLYGGAYLMDLATHMVYTIGDWDLSRPLSPDGTKVAAPLPISGVSTRTQIVVYDLFTNAHRLVLTHDPNTASQPVCFLTFLPQAMIGGSP